MCYHDLVTMRALRLILTFWVIAYLLNFFWEAWHAYYLYWGYRGKSFSDYSIPEYLALIEKASFVDAGILTAIFLVGFLIWKDWSWLAIGKGERCRLNFLRLTYFLITTIGVATWIEIKGVYLFKEWSYLPTMPIFFGLGLSPLVQLAVTGLLAFWILKKT